MQILLFVLTLLTVLSLLTYARLDTYVSFVLTRNQLEKYMQKNEREFFNLRNIKWYDDTPVTSKEANSKPSSSTSKLSLFPILNKDVKEQDFDLYNQVRYVTKRLIGELYGNTRFYKEINAKRPTFSDDILDALESTAQSLPKGQKISNVKDLANIDLGDKQLNDVFYLILKGTKREDSRKDALKSIKSESDVDNKEEKSVEDGYVSLIDYVNVDARKKLRVFLASKKLLTAITANTELVDEILAQRTALYNQVNQNIATPEAATAQFNQQFGTRISSIVNDHLLDFTVTKTDPRPYE